MYSFSIFFENALPLQDTPRGAPESLRILGGIGFKTTWHRMVIFKEAALLQ
jgi:hypothetical protein